MSTLTEIKSAVESLPLTEQEKLLNHLVVKLGVGCADEFPVREDHVLLLDERFAAYREDPLQASTWDEVKRRFAAQRG